MNKKGGEYEGGDGEEWEYKRHRSIKIKFIIMAVNL
jgi:hypothetical protein